jgi:hypothetical protein
MIINNLVVGLIIESFMGELEESKKELEEEKTLDKDRLVGEERLLFNAGMLPGKGKASGEYVARLTDYQSSGQRQKMLTELLPQKDTNDVEDPAASEDSESKKYDLGS